MIRAWGRIESPDHRDSLFAIAYKTSSRPSRTWEDSAWFGDQKASPMCCGFAWSHWLSSEPISQWLSPTGIYEIAKRFDEFKGENYEGTSVRAGAKVLHKLGLISAYHWAVNIDAVTYALLEEGPVVCGIGWKSGMMEPDAAGIIRAGGYTLGGHAFLLTGIDTVSGMIRIKNSYGRQWGLDGRAYIRIEDFATLLSAGGEACLAVERKASPEGWTLDAPEESGVVS